METDEKFQAKIEALSEEHVNDFRMLSPLESAVIKGHILVERELSRVIESTVPNKNAYKPSEYSFARKIVLADMLGLIAYCKADLLALNLLRNKIAHHLSFPPNLISGFVWGVYQKNPEHFDKHGKDIEALVKASISFLCGILAATSTLRSKED